MGLAAHRMRSCDPDLNDLIEQFMGMDGSLAFEFLSADPQPELPSNALPVAHSQPSFVEGPASSGSERNVESPAEHDVLSSLT
jgi:hypothetical protein